MSGEYIIDPELANDPDYQAYINAEQEGKYEGLEPGTFVAFFNGLLIATASSFDGLCEQETMQNLVGDVFIDQVNIEKPVYTLQRGPRFASNQQ